LLTGDLGFAAIEPFADALPDRFFNVGVAEQNMIGAATGLAEAGFLPFVYSIATFATLRPLEFIRNGPVLHHLPVRIVGIGAGFEYGHAGPTHYGIEDVAALRAQSDIAIISPADKLQAESALRSTWDLAGPVYYRLGKDESIVVPGLDGRFELGRAECLRQGGELVLIAMGAVASEAAAAAELLAQQGTLSTVLVVASVRPAPIDDLETALSGARAVLTVEAHSITGGLGSMVAEIIAERNLPCRLVRCGVRPLPDGISGSNDYMNAASGLSAEAIADRARAALAAS
jgi:transketolase